MLLLRLLQKQIAWNGYKESYIMGLGCQYIIGLEMLAFYPR
ncbi:MAG: hypothetical protein JSC189_000676 [Candidatus Tokpelaia sp. JSC189]|nr:MAG: hypothetical protein JSC189_000676 [Candidatus Tokpelaia sp. JSC189]